MASSKLASVGIAVFGLVLVVSCNGRIEHRRSCFGADDDAASDFCTDGEGAPSSPTPSGPFQGDPGGFDAGCAGGTVAAFEQGSSCKESGRGGRPPGSSCVVAWDCASVCCVAGADGVFRPGDAGAEAEADADADAGVGAGGVASVVVLQAVRARARRGMTGLISIPPSRRTRRANRHLRTASTPRSRGGSGRRRASRARPSGDSPR